MKNALLLIVCLLVGLSTPVWGQAETVILDFEDAATTTTFFYFGSPLDGSLNQTIANPDQSGINLSDSVAEHIRPANSETFAGAFSDPNPSTPLDLTDSSTRICIKVWAPQAPIQFLFKLEQGASDPQNGDYEWEQSDSIMVAQEWVELCFDPTIPSENGNGVVATGDVWAQPVVFFDFGQVRGDSSIYYFDDLFLVEDTSQMTSVRNLDASLFEVTNTLVTENAQLTFSSSLVKDIRLLSTNGQALRKASTNDTRYQLDLSGLPSGVYLIEVRTNGLRAVRRVVKQ